jgi:nitrogen fixation/metabolism regulation signal transduction histidine kinase
MTEPDPTELLAAMRRRVEDAAERLGGLAAEVEELRSRDDDLESLVDVLLGLVDAAVLVVDDDRRITALSRGAAARLDGAAVGKPLSSALGAAEFDAVSARLDAADAVGQAGGDGGGGVHPLPRGGAVLVLEDR